MTESTAEARFFSAVTPTSAPSGTWRFEVVFNGQTQSVNFQLGAVEPPRVNVVEYYAASLDHYFMTGFTTEEAAYLLDDSQARVLIHGAPMDERVAQLDAAGLARIVTPAAYEEFLSAGSATMPTGPAADDLCNRIRKAGGACFVLRNMGVRG